MKISKLFTKLISFFPKTKKKFITKKNFFLFIYKNYFLLTRNKHANFYERKRKFFFIHKRLKHEKETHTCLAEELLFESENKYRK